MLLDSHIGSYRVLSVVGGLKLQAKDLEGEVRSEGRKLRVERSVFDWFSRKSSAKDMGT